jgi:tRNA-binding protein
VLHACVPSTTEYTVLAQITYAYFEKVDMRTGKITQVEDFPKARRPAYKLWIHSGTIGTKKSSAHITRLYSKDDLIGKLIIAVVNFPPRRIADFESEVLVLGNNEVVLVQPDCDVPLGERVLKYFEPDFYLILIMLMAY